MKAIPLGVLAVFILAGAGGAEDFTVVSPSGNITAVVSFSAGGVTYTVKSGNTQVLDSSPLGIVTDKGDFSTGTVLAGSSQAEINETYSLPQGKRSTYLNHARELTLRLSKGGQEAQIRFRAYDDGIAFRYVLPGSGAINVVKETSGFHIASPDMTVWGQAHPNNTGYESPLGKVDGNLISMPALAEVKALNHWVFLANAADYGTYVICHFARNAGLFTVEFPINQTGPVTGTLPLETSWHFALFSPGDLKKIIESVMVENLNPPTETALAGAAWIRPGRSSWDYLGGEKNTVVPWVDFDGQMGWEYHIMDGGFEKRIDVKAAVATAAAKGVSLGGWVKATTMNTRPEAQAIFDRYAAEGLKEIKIDFFDLDPVTGAKTEDHEDTQASLKVRDYMSEIAAEKHMHIEFHGCAIPSGERRRWPHLMTYEAIRGMESHPPTPHECVIPFVRNMMGAVDYTLVDSKATTKSPAEQAGTAVIFESGIQVYAAPHAKIAAHPAVDFFKKAPANWDDTRFLEGYPESHATFARRKGNDWFVGAITVAARTAVIPLAAFLVPGYSYDADIFKDGASNQELVREKKSVTSKDTLRIALRAEGGLAIIFHPPVAPVSLRPMPSRAGSLSAAFTARGRDALLPPAFAGRASDLSVFDMEGRLIQRIRLQGRAAAPGTLPGGADAVRVFKAEAER